MIKIGTSGYHYPEWVGPFYPPQTKASSFLHHYMEHFDALEINSSFYRMPQKNALSRLAQRAKGRLEVVVKGHRCLTHDQNASPADYQNLQQALEPLADAGLLAGLLLQFPGAFRFSPQALAYLETLRERLRDMELIVEFRHSSWLSPQVAPLLREWRMALCCVDQPALPGLLPPLTTVTSSIAYVRLHGRNAQRWWNHQDGAERYDYLYSDQELAEWVDRLREMDQRAAKTFLFANNHFGGKAPANARRLQEMLAHQGLIPPPPRQDRGQMALPFLTDKEAR